MNLKKLIISLIIGMSLTTAVNCCFAEEVSDATLRKMISLYKNQNYLGCLQETFKIIEINPADAYAHYYQALSYQQLGKAEEAKAAFEKVATLNENSVLTEYAQKGQACTTSADECEKFEQNKPEIDVFLKSNKFVHDSVQKEINEKKLNRIKENINKDIKKKVTPQQMTR